MRWRITVLPPRWTLMKKPLFPLNSALSARGRPGNKAPLLWLFFHGGLLAALALSALLGSPPRINSSLMDILPSAGGTSVAAADALLSGRSSRQFVILSGAEDFTQAKAGAQAFYEALESAPGIETLTLWTDAAYLARLNRYLYDYRFMLLDGARVEALESGGEAEIAANALASVYGAFTFTPLDNLAGDPFLLAELHLKRFLASPLLSGGNLSLKDDVLAARVEGNWYVLLRGSLAPAGLALVEKANPVRRIYEAGGRALAEHTGARFYYSGVPFHSYQSSSSAQREISIISTIALIAVALLFLWVFRSPLPALASVAALGVSMASALAASLLVFREVHVLSFVFGTTLIGTCVDYSIHYFVYRRSLPVSASGMEVRSRLIRGISMSFVSTVICFTALLFAPFIILKQFAVFSAAGLLSSYLSVTCIYPFVWKVKAGVQNRALLSIAPRGLARRKARFALFAGIVLVLVILLYVNRERLRVENNIGGLYSMPAALMESEKINAAVMNYGASPWYFIVSGNSEEELLENEETLRSALDAEIAAGNLESYIAASLFIPSVKTQRASYEAAKKLLPLAASQFAALGFDGEAAEAYRREFAASENRFLVSGGAPFADELAANLLIGETGGRMFSCVLPLRAKAEAPFREIAAGQENVFLVNKVSDIGAALDRLTKIMLFLLCAAFAVIALVTRIFYPWGKTLRICAVPLFLVLAVLAVLSCLNIPLGFFTMVGLLLVFGLGLDYIFYGVESEKGGSEQPLTALAIFLSFITTALSFGALAFSGFAPVHLFGVTVFAGLCAAYISATLLTARAGSENQWNSGSDRSCAKE
jgi:predicted exporter